MSDSPGVYEAAAVAGAILSLPGVCQWCSSPTTGVWHQGACPRLKAIEYHPNGTVKRIELHPLPLVVNPAPTAGQYVTREKGT